jgi:hypothetical protein
VIFVMVKVPKDLSGASLLGVHNWVKSNIALSNPGASPDYKLTDPSGNRLTLSDVARNAGGNVNIEVATIQGVRKNPASNLTMIPGMDVKYADMVRGGNNLTDLLPDEIDSAMATRIIAEQGLHRGLHTLNRMSLSTYNQHISSPTTAALLQMGELIKKNPADRTPFSQRTPVHYGSEKALQTWLTDTASARGDDEQTIDVQMKVANTHVEDAKIAARYGLNTKDIGTFAQDVLSDYLFASSANRGLVRTLIRNLPELRLKKDSSAKETIQKLIHMFPTQAPSFYDGSQRVFVAHPAFIYPAYAEALLSKKEMRTIVDFAKGYPRNMGRNDKIPASLKKLVARNSGGLYGLFREFLAATPFGEPYTRGGAVDSSGKIEKKYREQGHLPTVLSALAADPRVDLSKRNFKQLRYFSDLGGFYPSPPPKWPRRLMYAIMDGFLENLPHIIDMDHPGGNTNLTPVQMAYFADPVIMSDSIKVKKEGSGGGKGGPDKTLADLKALLGQIELLIKTPVKKEIDDKINELKKDRFASKNADPAESLTFNQKRLQNIRDNINNAISKHVSATEAGKGAIKRAELSFEAAGPKSILEMVYDIAEIATAKYDYNMRGDDFKFTMAVVHYSFTALNERTHGNTFALTSKRVQKGIEDIMNGNRYDRLVRLEESVTNEALGEAPRASFKQTIFLAKLMAIHEDMKKEIDGANSTDERIRAIQENTKQHRKLIEKLQMDKMSPTLSAAVQRILFDMRTLLGDG